MKSISIPSNVIGYVGMAGFVMVGLSGSEIVLWPSWTIPLMGAFLGLFAVNNPKQFLIAGLALMGAKWGLNYLPVVGGVAKSVATELVRFVAPAMLIVSVRSLYDEMKG